MNIFLKEHKHKRKQGNICFALFCTTNIHYFLFKFKHDNIYEKLFHQYLN